MKNGNFNGNSNFNYSKSGGKVNIGAVSCLFFVIVIDMAIEKSYTNFSELNNPNGSGNK